MPKIDKLINVKDDAMVHRELLELDSPKISAKEYRNYASMIQELHQERLESYALKRGISIDKATLEIMRLHSEGVNVASHISFIIGVPHNKYMTRLTELHENPWFVR
jgi:hypothetical protein